MPIAILTRREPAGSALSRLVLDVDAVTAHSHVRHGQYVEVRLAANAEGAAPVTSYYALASTPSSAAFEVLVKPSAGMSERLLEAAIGDRFEVSEARGQGFPVEAQRGLPLVLAATGSGISAVLSALAARAASPDAARTYLLYGVRERREIAVEGAIAEARRAGVQVAICLSREHADEPGFFRGYVQEVARAHAWVLEGGRVFAAGSKAMLEGMRTAAPSLGLSLGDVLTNF
jgi:NAD(P)H-flavin reductase